MYLTTKQACRLLGYSSVSAEYLRRLKIRSIKILSSYCWNLQDINAELARRKKISHPPPGCLTLSEVAEKISHTSPYTHHFLRKHKITPSYCTLWRNHASRQIPVYHLRQIDKLLNKLQKEKYAFPPEGWLTISDCTSFLNCSAETVRTYVRKGEIRAKKIHHSKQLYNEDDIITLRKKLRGRANRFNLPSTQD